MKKVAYVLLFIVLGFLLFLLFYSKKPVKEENNTPEPMAFLDGAVAVDLPLSTRQKFAKNYLGDDSGNVTVYVYVLSGNLPKDINRQIHLLGWNMVEDWNYPGQVAYMQSKWQTNTELMTIVLLKDLDTTGIDSLKKNYDVQELVIQNDNFFIVMVSAK